MPSVCNGVAPAMAEAAVTPAVEELPTKQCLTLVEKKIRNLEKRKGKLDAYFAKEQGGEKLNKDQKDALAQRDSLTQVLECLHEIQKQMITVVVEAEKQLEKQQRKQARRQQLERRKEDVNRLAQLFQLQQLLKKDFTAAQTELLVEEKDDQLNSFRQMVTPEKENTSDSDSQYEKEAEVVLDYLDGKDGSFNGCEFKVFRDLINTIQNVETAKHFVEEPVQEVKEVEAEEEIENNVVEEKALPSVVQEEQTTDLQSELSSTILQTENNADTLQISGHSNGQPVQYLNSELNGALFPAQSQPSRVKQPQEIVSAISGSYNFLQDSEIEETEQLPVTNGSMSSFGFVDQYGSMPSSYTATNAQIADSHQLLMAQPPYSAHMTLPYGQHMVIDGVYMPHPHALPVSYGSPIAMTTGYNLVNAYSQSVVSHENGGVMAAPHPFYDPSTHIIVGEQPQEQSLLNISSFSGLNAAESMKEDMVPPETQKSAEEAVADGTSAETQKKTFSMNPNANVFTSKNFQNSENEPALNTAENDEDTQGSFIEKRNRRGGRGGRGYGGRGGNQNYTARGGAGSGYQQRYPRSDYRQEGQNGYSGEFNGWRGQRRDRGGRGGAPNPSRGFTKGGYERNAPQEAGQ